MMPSMPLSLKERIPVFARQLPGAELIDELVLTPEQRKAQKADFFFERRRIIAEAKVLEADPAWKIEDRLKPYQRRPEWPIFYGAWELSKILRKFPDGADINRKVFEAITSAILKHITDANRQIRDTKKTFRLSDSGGFLILGNDSITILSPIVIAHRVHRVLNKRTPQGEPQFPHINTVWMISENYVADLGDGRTGIPALVFQNDVPDPANVEGFSDTLHHRWAAFHGVPLVVSKGANLDEMSFREHLPPYDVPSHRNKARWQSWEEEYDSHPYLAHLSVPRLVRHAERLFAQLLPGALKGSTADQQNHFQQLMRPWTHFLREVNRRGLDMRELAPTLRGLGRKVRAGQALDKLGQLGRNDLCWCASGKKFKHCHGRPV